MRSKRFTEIVLLRIYNENVFKPEKNYDLTGVRVEFNHGRTLKQLLKLFFVQWVVLVSAE